jgi:membrane-bound ClpP family serine protease
MPIVALVLLFLTALLAPGADVAGRGPEAASTATPRVGYLPINGAIDQGKAAYFKRALAKAKEQHLTHVVVHLTTPGGELGAGMEMLNACLDTPKDAPRLIAFVDDHSLSAGSLIAYGHDEILVTAKAMLGDIGVITMSSDGKIEYLPEKIETVVRTLLRNAAQNRGWDQAKLVKMTARTQELYRFDLGAGKQAYVIEDDLGTWLAAHPEIKGESKVLTLGKASQLPTQFLARGG